MTELSEYVPVPRAVVEALVYEVGRELPSSIIVDLEKSLVSDLTTGIEVSPPWSKVRLMAEHLERLIGERGPIATAQLDQLRATMRDELDTLEVSLRDEWVIYHGLVWVGMVVELARHGYRNGAVGVDTLAAVKEIGTTIASALLEFLPPEARK